MFPILIAASFVAAVYLFLVMPSRPGEETAAPFRGRNYAHRGLYERDQSVPENSLAAFRRARDAGYGVELDLQLSRSGDVVVVHDDTLERVCSVSGRAPDYETGELRLFRLCGTDEPIPLFSEVLGLMDGREPMIVEFKTGPNNALLCEKAAALLNAYPGPYCVESFDPRILLWFRKNRPGVLRGQLACGRKGYAKKTNPLFAFLASRCFMNFLSRPHFIAYEIGGKPFSVRAAERLGAMPVCWTSHGPEHEAKNEMVIFEHYRPGTRYRG